MSASPLLRLVICGSVDDGKSTLLGRLLAELGALTIEQAEAVERAGGDHSAVLDGLVAEREQGITIDLAWRGFETAQRRYRVADAPGHEQYTRNMTTAASTADAALVLVDARAGIVTQTRRHLRICALMGVGDVLLLVNKLDLVADPRAGFADIAAEFAGLAHELGFARAQALPVIARDGDNLCARGDRLAWWEGPTLVEALDALEPPASDAGGTLLAVQWVARQAGGGRALAGTLRGGALSVGDRMRLAGGTGASTTAAELWCRGVRNSRAEGGDPVAVILDPPLDAGRGAVLLADAAELDSADQFEVDLLWFAEDPLVVGRGYRMQLGAQEAVAVVRAPDHVVDVDSGTHMAARTLATNDIGVAKIACDTCLSFRPYAQDRAFGGFILIDMDSQATVGAGMIRHALYRSSTVRPQPVTMTPQARAALLGQRPRLVWLTGLSGAGKSTIADALDRALAAKGRHATLLDGDNLRHGLNRDLGFTEADRIENIRRAGEVARLMVDAGLFVIAAFISPYRADRALVRALLGDDRFIEVHVDVPLTEAERRDPKGLYRRARAGEIANFTGVSSPYEPPEAPDLRIDTSVTSVDDAVAMILELLRA